MLFRNITRKAKKLDHVFTFSQHPTLSSQEDKKLQILKY